MQILASTIQKTEAMLETVKNLEAGDFPQNHAKETLTEIGAVFDEHLKQLNDLKKGGAPKAEAVYCTAVLDDLFVFLPILGFLHRSKNASNAFEMYGPLLRMARQLIGNDTKLVLSSEWDFSPFTMLEMPSLPNIVLIGLPASECANALLVPLAGHEFGHSIWSLEKARKTYEPTLAQAVVQAIRTHWSEYQKHYPDVKDGTLTTDIFAQQTWLPALKWSLRQCEEVFCDLVGLRTFGEAYFHAFAYLLAPGMPSRQPFYPSDQQRADYLTRAAAHWGITVPTTFKSSFQAPAPTISTLEQFLIDTADRATVSLLPSLIAHVNKWCTSKGVSLPTTEEITSVFDAFRKLVPAAHPNTLSSIINAGWRAVHDPDLWGDYPRVAARRTLALNELMRKTAQVLEVSQLLTSS